MEGSRVYAFEGFEYSGKDTQIEILVKKTGWDVLGEPKSGILGPDVRRLTVEEYLGLSDFSRAMLLFAAREPLWNNDIRSLRDSGQGVVVNRCFVSTYVLQGESLTDELMAVLVEKSYSAELMDGVVFINVSKEEVLRRMESREKQDHLDVKFVKRIEHYLHRYEMAKEFLKKWFPDVEIINIDGDRSPEEVHRQICTELRL